MYLQALVSGHDRGRGQAGWPPTAGGLEGADGGRGRSSDRLPLGDRGRLLSHSSYGNRATKTQLMNGYTTLTLEYVYIDIRTIL